MRRYIALSGRELSRGSMPSARSVGGPITTGSKGTRAVSGEMFPARRPVVTELRRIAGRKPALVCFLGVLNPPPVSFRYIYVRSILHVPCVRR
jgi:hypothetical protein